MAHSFGTQELHLCYACQQHVTSGSQLWHPRSTCLWCLPASMYFLDHSLAFKEYKIPVPVYSFDTHSSKRHLFFLHLASAIGSLKTICVVCGCCYWNYRCVVRANNHLVHGSQLWRTRITCVWCLSATCNYWLTTLAPKKCMLAMTDSKKKTNVISGSQIGIK